jgi:pyruvate/2-oxoglutarate/acetoin dehydrogenase E1 component
MRWLSDQPLTLFIGQAVAYPGTAMFNTLEGVPNAQRIELPVIEDAQMGMSTGLALDGWVPITIYPRINFMLLAMNQLVLHLDKLPIYSNGGYAPKVIIRTAIASREPLDPQAQHWGEYTKGIGNMLWSTRVIELSFEHEIFPAYQKAYNEPGSFLIVERTDLYA